MSVKAKIEVDGKVFEYPVIEGSEKEKAIESGDWEKAKQMAGRSIKITPETMADAKKLVRLMGCPVVEAPCEAEA